MAVYSQMINKFRRFHLLKGLFIILTSSSMFVKIFTDILSNQISFRVVKSFLFFWFFLFLFNFEQHHIDPEKNLVLIDYRPVFMVFYFLKMKCRLRILKFYIQFYYHFLCFKCPIIANISAHCKQKKNK